MTNIEDQTKNKSTIIYFSMIVFLLIGMSFFAFKWSSSNSENEEISKKNSDMQAELDQMSEYKEMIIDFIGKESDNMKSDLDNMLLTYNELIKKDESKADSINIQKKAIEDLREKLEKSKNISANQFKKMQKENETLKGIMRGYVQQIDSLYTMTQKLTFDLDEKSNQLNLTKEERDNFRKEAEESAEQVKIGSKLRAYNIKSGALKMKTSNTTEETNRSKKAYQFFTSFTLQENLIAKVGKRTIYFQVTGPNGSIYMSSNSNTTNTTEGILTYSEKKTIDYNRQAVDVAIYYNLKGENAEKGKYKVKLICDGVIIGENNFILK